jgi:hypothetical protein
MTTQHEFMGCLIVVDQKLEGFAWMYDDGAFLTAGTEFYPSRQQALQAAKQEIQREQEAAR